MPQRIIRSQGDHLMQIYLKLRRLIAIVAFLVIGINLLQVLLIAAQVGYQLRINTGLAGILIIIWSGLSGFSKTTQLSGGSYQRVTLMSVFFWIIAYLAFRSEFIPNEKFTSALPWFYFWFFGWPLVDLVDLIMMHNLKHTKLWTVRVVSRGWTYEVSYNHGSWSTSVFDPNSQLKRGSMSNMFNLPDDTPLIVNISLLWEVIKEQLS